MSRARFSYNLNQRGGVTDALSNTEEYRSLRDARKQFQNRASTAKSSADIEMLRQSYDRLQEAQRRVMMRTRALNKQFSAASFATKSLSDSLRNLARSHLSVFAAIGAGAGVTNIGQELISLNTSLLASEGSAVAAADAFDFVTDASLKLGLNLSTATKSFSQLSVAAKLAGVESEDVKEAFLGIAEAGAVFGMSKVDMERAMRSINQMMNKGQVMAEELKLQLGESLPGAVGLAAEAMEMAPKEFLKAMERGEVVTSEFLPKFSKRLRELARDGGALEKGMNSSRVAMARLGTSFELNVLKKFESGFESGLATLFNSLTQLVLNLGPSFEVIGSFFGLLLKIVGPMLVIVTQVFRPMGMLLSQIVGVTKDATGEMNAFGRAVSAVGFALLIIPAYIERALDWMDSLTGGAKLAATAFTSLAFAVIGFKVAAMGGMLGWVLRLVTGFGLLQKVLGGVASLFRMIAGTKAVQTSIAPIVKKAAARFVAGRVATAPLNAVPGVGQLAFGATTLAGVGMFGYDIYKGMTGSGSQPVQKQGDQIKQDFHINLPDAKTAEAFVNGVTTKAPPN